MLRESVGSVGGSFSAIAAVTLVGLLLTGPLWANVNEFRLIFPQAVKGTAGFYFETRIVVTNPGAEPVEVALESEQFELDGETAAFELGPHETREILLAGEPLQVGSVELTASTPVAGSAFILSKESAEAEEILSEVSVIGTPPMTKAVLPVFVDSPLAENTGIAVRYLRYATGMEVRFTLYDSEGQEIATRQEAMPFDPKREPPAPLSDQTAFFVTELFPDLPPAFRQGSLVVDRPVTAPVPDNFALVALYTRGSRFWAAEVAAPDVIGSYTVRASSGQDLEQLAALLAETYGFEVYLIVDDHNFFSIRATREVARAVSRDSRVAEVAGVLPVSLSQ